MSRPGVLSQMIMAAALRTLPAARADWGRAMLAELHCLPPEPWLQTAWALGSFRSALLLRLTHPPMAYAAVASLSLAVLVFVDWHTESTVASISLLMGVAAGLTFWAPQRFVRAIVLTGGTLFLAHAASNFTGLLRPYYQCAPLDSIDWLILSALVVPAFIGAAAGLFLRKASGRIRARLT